MLNNLIHIVGYLIFALLMATIAILYRNPDTKQKLNAAREMLAADLRKSKHSPPKDKSQK